jgi:hypothetical protein
MKEPRTLGLRLIVIAVIYLMAALIIGFVMGVTEDFTFQSVHTHLGLLGWATMALTGIVYVVLPACERSVLASVHFWLHNIGLPLMMAALAVLDYSGDARVKPVLGIGSFMVVVALLVFTVNLARNGRASATGSPSSYASQ